MGIATVRGAFKKFEGTVDATGEAPSLSGSVEIASIDTGDENRDGHLQSPEFFDAERSPQITFHTTATEAIGDDQIKLPARSRSRASPSRSN